MTAANNSHSSFNLASSDGKELRRLPDMISLRYLKLRRIIEQKEKSLINGCNLFFKDIKDDIKECFSELKKRIELEQKREMKKLQGTIMKHVDEYLSSNDKKLLVILKMPPGEEKKTKLEELYERIIEEGENLFCNSLLSCEFLYPE